MLCGLEGTLTRRMQALSANCWDVPRSPAHLMEMKLPEETDICSLAISIKGYNKKSILTVVPRCLPCVWRLRLFMFREHCSHLDASLANWRWRGGLLFISGTGTSMTEMQTPWLSSWALLSLLIDFKSPCPSFCCLRNVSLSRLQFWKHQHFCCCCCCSKKFHISSSSPLCILWS